MWHCHHQSCEPTSDRTTPQRTAEYYAGEAINTNSARRLPAAGERLNAILAGNGREKATACPLTIAAVTRAASAGSSCKVSLSVAGTQAAGR